MNIKTKMDMKNEDVHFEATLIHFQYLDNANNVIYSMY